MFISVKCICHVPYGTYIWNIIYMGHTMSISMKSICDVCMYIRMYARVHARMHVCLYVCMYECMYACMHVCVSECVCDKNKSKIC